MGFGTPPCHFRPPLKCRGGGGAAGGGFGGGLGMALGMAGFASGGLAKMGFGVRGWHFNGGLKCHSGVPNPILEIMEIVTVIPQLSTGLLIQV